MREFMGYLITERGYSEKTKDAYERDLNDFCQFLENSGDPSLTAVDHLDVRVYLAFLNDQKYSRNTISRKIASLRSFYQYLLKHEKIKENPFSYVHLKKKHARLPRFFYEKEIEVLFDSVEGTKTLEQRNRALLEVLYGSGLRVSECANLTLSVIDFDNSVMLINCPITAGIPNRREKWLAIVVLIKIRHNTPINSTFLILSQNIHTD